VVNHHRQHRQTTQTLQLGDVAGQPLGSL
jgi:hypothetical protein